MQAHDSESFTCMTIAHLDAAEAHSQNQQAAILQPEMTHHFHQGPCIHGIVKE